MDAIYKEHATKQGLILCKEFKFQEIMDEYLSTAKVIPEMLNSSTALRKHGNITIRKELCNHSINCKIIYKQSSSCNHNHS